MAIMIQHRSITFESFWRAFYIAIIVLIVSINLSTAVMEQLSPDKGFCEYENSWSFYYEMPCCSHSNSHHLRHHKENVREFTCGKLYYRTFQLDEERDALYVGAMNRVYRLNLKNISLSGCEKNHLLLEPTESDVRDCISKGKTQRFECRNHIRVIQSMENGNRLYICGTNAHSPKDYVIYSIT
ncbi:semaphorin-2A-like [Sitodiplosis mosellana]|uniref:semaphorin-2A-like n=1 Tax=Sitodiplosis mosellana TaxID=263140 RepID=UPI0024437824|nr:semaphorin-2A-like [Sitodiplosis mosellana]